MQKRKGIHSLFFRTFFPFLIVLFFIIALYTIVLQKNSIIYLKTNANSFFAEQVATRSLYVQNEMTNRWSAIHSSAALITSKIEETVFDQHVSLSQIQKDPALNNLILHNVMGDILGTLRTCGATEIFLILDGPNVQQKNQTNSKAGIYLRNSSPEYYTPNNQSILCERGMPSLSKKWKLPLDSFWSAGFDFSNENDSANDYFTKPLNSAKQHNNSVAENFSYWSYGHPIHQNDIGVLTYSIPLIASDGSVLGVMGIGVSEEYFVKTIDYKSIGAQNEHSGAYILAKTTDNINFEPVIFNGVYYNKNSFLNQNLTISAPAGDDIHYISYPGQNASKICASTKALKLYNNNTPFENEQWHIIGLLPDKVLFQAYNKANSIMMVLAIGAILLSLLGAYWISSLLAKPIDRLIDQLRKSDPNRPIQLECVNIEEIDELTLSIETLSKRVAAAFSKISTIIQMAESGIGVFEYKVKENLVFCSRTLYEMLDWVPVIDSNAYIDGHEFAGRMKRLEQYAVKSELNLYEIPQGIHGSKWIKMNYIYTDHSYLGVLTDITATILEKRQIEYERDYDILTNLYNRRGFDEQLQVLTEQPDTLKKAGFLVWDLDNLKYINDNYGHTLGDAYIIALADCLKKFNNNQVMSCRRSGDEFITIIYGFDTDEAILEIVQTIWSKIEKVYIRLPGGNEYKVRVSAGLARYPLDTDNMPQLFQYADFAMYTAKHNHKGTLEIFNLSTYNENKILLQGQEEFHNLLDKHLVKYVLQPIVSVSDGSIYGYEMLMRSTVELFQSPLDILRMANAQYKLYDIEVMTWFEAMRTFVQLEECGMLVEGCKVFINSLANQILQPNMIQLFEKTYSKYLSQIICEFTEEYQHNPQMTSSKTKLMDEWNAMIAIDDFGCGYNNESILLDISPNIIKIDMSIVRGIDSDVNRQQLVENLLLYAKQRDILVLAEGVETSEEAEALIALGIDLLQGYYIGAPTSNGAIASPSVLEAVVTYYQKYQ